MSNPLARARHNASINPQLNPSINPGVNAALNPIFNPWINPERNTRINPKFNQSSNPLLTPSLNPARNCLLDPKQTRKFSGLYRLTPDSELMGYVVRTSNKAVCFSSTRTSIGQPTPWTIAGKATTCSIWKETGKGTRSRTGPAGGTSSASRAIGQASLPIADSRLRKGATSMGGTPPGRPTPPPPRRGRSVRGRLQLR